MDILNAVVDFLLSPAGTGILAGLFLISEALASISSLKANSVFQLLASILRRFKPVKPL